MPLVEARNWYWNHNKMCGKITMILLTVYDTVLRIRDVLSPIPDPT
jgi:hypothetical protein